MSDTGKIKVSIRKHDGCSGPLDTNNEVNKTQNINITAQLNKMIEARRDIFLTLINKILEHVKLPTITKLTDFIDVERDLLVQDSISNIINTMEQELYLFFSKNASSHKKKSKKYTLNCLKNFAKQSNLAFVYKKRDSSVTINGLNYRRIVYVYTLKDL